MNFPKQPSLRQTRRDGASANRTNLHFHIGRLTLTGLPKISHENVIAALRHRLTTLAEQIPERNWSQVSAPLQVDGGQISADSTSEQLGDHLAKQIMQLIIHTNVPHDRYS